MSFFKLLFNTRIVSCLSVMALLGSVGCSDDEVSPDGNPPNGNHPPEVVFGVSAIAVPRSTSLAARRVTLVVSVSDPDEDPVTVLWKVTRDGQPSGSLDPAQQGQPSIRWQTPIETGRDTITVTASDGKTGGSTTLVETIEVGTLKDSRIQTAPETWNVVDSPFIIRPIEEDFVIDERMKLTVEAGSKLLIDRTGLTISVVGTLQTDGTVQAPVIIRPNARKSQPGDWQGVTANPSGNPPTVRLSYTHVMYATDAIKANTTAEVFLDGCRIVHSSDAAVLHTSSGELRVENSVIANNVNSGIKIRKIVEPLPATVVISGDSITSNGDLTGQTPYVDQAGVYIDIPDVDGLSAITISGNEISFNGVPGIHLVSSCYPIMNNNTIFANELGKSGTRYNIKLEKNFGGKSDTLDAALNYWGGSYPPATGEALIKQMIRDSEDDGSIGVRVVVDPWLNAKP